MRAAPLPAPPRTEVVAAPFSFGLAVLGGLTADGNPSAQVDHYTFGRDVWRSLPALPVALHHAGAGQLGDRLFAEAEPRPGGIGAATVKRAPCVAGGGAPGDRTIAEVECLRDGAWKVVGKLEVPRHGLAVVTPDAQLHVIGGGPKPGLHVSDVHEMFFL